MNCTLRILIVRALLLFFVALPSWSAGPALAAGLDNKAAGDLQEAKRLYKSGKYEEAADIFSRLSAAHPDLPVFARNAGACYYYLRRPEPALSNLRDYLYSQKRITTEDRTEVEGWIMEMEKLRDQNAPTASDRRPPSVLSAPAVPASTGLGIEPQGQAATGPVPTGNPAPGTVPGAVAPGYGPGYPSASAPVSVGVPTRGVAQPASVAPGQFPNLGLPQQGYNVMPSSPPASPPTTDNGYSQGRPPASGPFQQPYASQPGAPSAYPLPNQNVSATGEAAGNERQSPATNNNAAWLVGGLGVAVLATGGIFTILSQSAFSDTVDQYDSSKEKSGKTYAYLGAACYGLGAAGVVTAAIMMLMNDHHSSSGSIAFSPVIRPDAMGAVVHYTY